MARFSFQLLCINLARIVYNIHCWCYCAGVVILFQGGGFAVSSQAKCQNVFHCSAAVMQVVSANLIKGDLAKPVDQNLKLSGVSASQNLFSTESSSMILLPKERFQIWPTLRARYFGHVLGDSFDVPLRRKRDIAAGKHVCRVVQEATRYRGHLTRAHVQFLV